tara:strand:+ start:254 stop:418 length:165 start_codon:yes stop_codon:yes gene_type:complete
MAPIGKGIGKAEKKSMGRRLKTDTHFFEQTLHFHDIFIPPQATIEAHRTWTWPK